MTTTTKATKFIIGAKDINTAIASITKRGKKLDDDIQLCALSVINHIELHGDITVANKLFLGMPRGSRKNALAEFLVSYAKIDISLENTKEIPFTYNKEKTTNLAMAETMHWTEFKPEPDLITAFNLNAEIAKLIGKVTKLQDQDGGCEIEGLDNLAKLQALTA